MNKSLNKTLNKNLAKLNTKEPNQLFNKTNPIQDGTNLLKFESERFNENEEESKRQQPITIGEDGKYN